MMRLAKITNSLLLLALPAAFAVGAAAQEHPNVQPSQVKNQLAQAAPSGPAQAQSQAGKPSQPPAPTKSPSPAKSPVKAPVPANANPQGATKAPMKSSAPAKTTTPASKTGTKHPPVKTEAKAPQKTPEKAPPKASAAAENKPPAKAPAKTEAKAKAKEKKPVEGPIELAHVARRDPFESLLARQQTAGGATPANLPQGKPGLIVGTLRVDGIVKSSNGMIAIVSNPQQRVYFLRDGDKLYDGSVEHITLEGISFHEEGKDAFGKPIEREVTKRLYPSSGEQQ